MNNMSTCGQGLIARVPAQYKQNSYSDPACAVPSCGQNPAILAECCGKSLNEINSFDTIDGPYLTCTISETDEEKYQAFQNCLVRESAYPVKCNNRGGITNDGCAFSGVINGPVGTCSVQGTVNGTRALAKCCENGLDGVQANAEACFAYCTFNDSSQRTLEDCLRDSPSVDAVLCSLENGNFRETSGGTSLRQKSVTKFGWSTVIVGTLVASILVSQFTN